jgi:hypothetical protein
MRKEALKFLGPITAAERKKYGMGRAKRKAPKRTKP